MCDWIAGLQAVAETQAVVAELQRVAAELAEWQKRAGEFAAVSVGQAIHHPSWMFHAMRVLNEPLAALYLWRGGDLAAKSVILPG